MRPSISTIAMMMASNVSTRRLRGLLGLRLHANRLSNCLEALSASDTVLDLQVKSYSDAVYLNYYALGISLLFNPENGYQPITGAKLSDLNGEKLTLDSIYLYNAQPSARASEAAFKSFSPTSFVLDFRGVDETKQERELVVNRGTTGKDFVARFGEPSRKGGGGGPSSGSIGIWCEWSKSGLMVEFGGKEAAGPHAWDSGKDAVWKVITLFQSNQ